jgi:Flp pilus assembly secretin CpaC
MSRLWLAAAFVAAAGVTQAHSAGDVISVTLDQAKISRLPPGASTIILGNPMIADVTMVKNTDTVVITGRGFGQTNLIAIDSSGAVIEERQLRVVPARTVVVLQNGTSRIS